MRLLVAQRHKAFAGCALEAVRRTQCHLGKLQCAWQQNTLTHTYMLIQMHLNSEARELRCAMRCFNSTPFLVHYCSETSFHITTSPTAYASKGTCAQVCSTFDMSLLAVVVVAVACNILPCRNMRFKYSCYNNFHLFVVVVVVGIFSLVFCLRTSIVNGYLRLC